MFYDGIASIASSVMVPGLEDPMANLSIRNFDDQMMQRLRRRAARHGVSVEAEVRAILAFSLEGEADQGFEELAAELRALTKGRKHTPSEVLQREGRDER